MYTSYSGKVQDLRSGWTDGLMEEDAPRSDEWEDVGEENITDSLELEQQLIDPGKRVTLAHAMQAFRVLNHASHRQSAQS